MTTAAADANARARPGWRTGVCARAAPWQVASAGARGWACRSYGRWGCGTGVGGRSLMVRGAQPHRSARLVAVRRCRRPAADRYADHPRLTHPRWRRGGGGDERGRGEGQASDQERAAHRCVADAEVVLGRAVAGGCRAGGGAARADVDGGGQGAAAVEGDRVRSRGQALADRAASAGHVGQGRQGYRSRQGLAGRGAVGGRAFVGVVDPDAGAGGGRVRLDCGVRRLGRCRGPELRSALFVAAAATT